ncbi:hypothetical protein KO498_04945 [Lentibacter algarum]|uniref:hypothetical protein n=1 Tax=Lentibacter algarum TaxID=576131 RepID=UPI001C07781C|nr:hypothetical protein [Lentibacter algarum]MBU2981156.1 hypothetical protein [Lentibacter algarum]
MATKPTLLSSEFYSRTGQASAHPLSWPKTAPALDIIQRLEWFDNSCQIECTKVHPRRLRTFHDQAYIDAAYTAEAEQSVSPLVRQKYGLGTGDNPVFPKVIERAATARNAVVRPAAAPIDVRLTA